MDEIQQLPEPGNEPAPDTGARVTGGRRLASFGRWTWEWLKSLVVAFALFLLIRTFAIEAFRIRDPFRGVEHALRRDRGLRQ